MAGIRAPKEWALSKENLTSFKACRQNLQYTLSLNTNIASFLVWQTTNVTPLRDLVNDSADIPEAIRRTSAQKISYLGCIVGQTANYCSVIS